MNHEPTNPEPADENRPGRGVERNSFRHGTTPADEQCVGADSANHDATPLTPDDPRLTAYVLGELDNAERKIVERALAGSEACRRAVDEIRHSTRLVVAALAAEPVDTLSSKQRFKVERSIKHAANQDYRSPLPMILAGSVLVLSVASVGLWWVMGRGAARHVVIVDDSGSAAASSESKVEERTPAEVWIEQVGGRPDGGRGDHPIATSASGDSGRMSLESESAPTTDPGAHFYTGYAWSSERLSRKADQFRVGFSQAVGGAVGRRELDGFEGKSARQKLGEGEIAFDDEHSAESYSRIYENPFLGVRQNPLSTFSIDVDTASYANVRRFLNQRALPPKDAVRIEELVNYFKYRYAPPEGDAPFAVHAEIAGCPWRPEHRLLRIAIKGREIDLANRPASNLVFLVDVSGSMDEPDKLPLLKSAMAMLVDQLGENDRVAMVVYAGSSGLVLPATSGERKAEIRSALEQLQAGGSTNGASGIELAYLVARQNFIRGGTNRVLLATDGDFNVGVTDEGSLTRLIEEQAKSGVFLSVLGFGRGNLKDATMEKLADKGNGNYAYIDGPSEARKVLVEQLGGTLVTIAKDVKLQLEFNPAQVAAYRLVGYENRMLRNEDFNDDRKDAGEIGAGHTVTAFYELVPAGGEARSGPADPLKYQRVVEPTEAAASGETLTLALRYKAPEASESQRMTTVIKDAGRSYAETGEDFKFAAAVAAFGLVLRDSEFKGNVTLAGVLELAQEGRGADEEGYRAEFIELVKKAQEIAGQ